LQGVQKQQHKAHMSHHRTRYIADHDQAGLVAPAVFEVQVKRHAIVSGIGFEGAPQVDATRHADALPL
jgi:hypothetical protein